MVNPSAHISYNLSYQSFHKRTPQDFAGRLECEIHLFFLLRLVYIHSPICLLYLHLDRNSPPPNVLEIIAGSFQLREEIVCVHRRVRFGPCSRSSRSSTLRSCRDWISTSTVFVTRTVSLRSGVSSDRGTLPSLTLGPLMSWEK